MNETELTNLIAELEAEIEAITQGKKLEKEKAKDMFALPPHHLH